MSESHVDLISKLTISSMFFIFTSAISVYGVWYFRQNGALPGDSPSSDPSSIEAQTKDAFSTADQNDYDAGQMQPSHDEDQDEDQYALLHANEGGENTHPGRPLSWGRGDDYAQDAYEAPYNPRYSRSHAELQDEAAEPYPQQPHSNQPYPHGTNAGGPFGNVNLQQLPPYAEEDYEYRAPLR